MPSTYAHFCLGRETARLLTPEPLEAITRYPQLYSIGLHGPDLFFYYKPLSKNPVSRLGHEFHDRPGRDFFERAARVLQMHPNSLAHRAYVYGFLCHFALDTLSHDYVAEKEAASGLSHARIESELERALMLRDGLDPASYRPTGHMVPSEENAAVIADFFPEVTQEQVLDSLRGMVFYLDLLVAPSALKRWVIFTALRLCREFWQVSLRSWAGWWSALTRNPGVRTAMRNCSGGSIGQRSWQPGSSGTLTGWWRAVRQRTPSMGAPLIPSRNRRQQTHEQTETHPGGAQLGSL